MDDDVEISDLPCPACGHSYIHFRDCNSCDEGWIDLHDEDAINYAPGEELERCPECRGEGCLRWCPKCGEDYVVSLAKAIKDGRVEKCDDHRRRMDSNDECPDCHDNGWVFVKQDKPI